MKKKEPLLSGSFIIFSVNPTGKMSNFLFEDYEAVLKFMSAETKKKKLLKL